LAGDQLAKVAAALAQGPRANEFPAGMRTLARVAEMTEQITGVRYAQTQTWTVLRERLEQAPPGAARGGAQRGGNHHPGQAGLAADKKAPRRSGEAGP